MPAHGGPATALMLLLILAGGHKIVDPAPTGGALRSAGMPGRPWMVRALGMVEIVVGAWFVTSGGRLPAIAGALLYAAFGWFVINAMVRELPLSSCGCLGASDTPPTGIHVAVNLLAVVTLTLAAIIPFGPLGGAWGEELTLAVPYWVFIAATVVLLYGVLAVLPAIRRTSSPMTLLPEPVRRAR